MQDTEVKFFKKSTAMSVGRPLSMSTQPFTGTFSSRNKKMPRVAKLGASRTFGEQSDHIKLRRQYLFFHAW